jgi:putative membrane protein
LPDNFSGTFAFALHPIPVQTNNAPAASVAAPQECPTMFVRLSAAIAAVSLLSSAALAQGAKLTDPQIAHIAYTAGVIDIAAAKQALSKTRNKDVKAFAEDMVRDHQAVNNQALALVKKLNVTPEDNDTSKTLSKNAAAKRAELGKLKGAEFDKAYVANEVAYHKQVDSALETTLIPDASNAELKSLLQTGLKIFEGHEQHAEHVAASLK